MKTPLGWPAWALSLLGLAVGMQGCSDPVGAPANVPQPSARAAAGANKAASVGQDANAQAGQAEVSTFSYSPVGRRDPFRSYLTQVKERQEAQTQDHRHEDTENFEVAQYHLTGLITGTSQPKAMVDDPNGDAHVLHVGSRVGKNGGRVYSIGAQGVVVLEEYLDASGKAVSVPIKVRLPDDIYQDAATKE